MNWREDSDISQQEWLGARWSSWGCAALLGSLAIAGLAVVTILYGIFTIPTAFGPGGLLSPDAALMPPFEPPPDREKLRGIPPTGVSEFTTGQTLRLNDTLFTVTRTALDWAPPPPRTPKLEYTVVEIRLENQGAGPVQLDSEQFRMETAWNWEGLYEPDRTLEVPNLLTDRSVRPGEIAQGMLVFARHDIRQVRKYLIYRPPFWEGTVRVLLIP